MSTAKQLCYKIIINLVIFKKIQLVRACVARKDLFPVKTFIPVRAPLSLKDQWHLTDQPCRKA